MILAPALLAVAALAAGDGVLARAGEVTLTRADVAERVRVLASGGAQVTPSQALDGLLDEALLATEARRQGLLGPEIRAELERQRRRLAVERLLETELAGPAPTDAELKELYHAGADTVRLVLVKVETEAQARAVLERVRAGGDLAKEARAGLDADLAAKGGDTGPVARAALDPALAELAFQAKPGTLLGPVPLRLGFAVARVTSRELADESAFPSRRPALAAFARNRRVEAARRHVLPQLEKKLGLTVDEPFVKSLPQGPPTPEQLAHPVATLGGKPVPYREIEPAVSRVLRSVGGHMNSPGVRLGVVQEQLRERVLQETALERGHGRHPEVEATLRAIERNLLAAALAERLGAGGGRGDQAKLGELLGRLRQATPVSIDRKMLAELQASGT